MGDIYLLAGKRPFMIESSTVDLFRSIPLTLMTIEQTFVFEVKNG